VEKGSIVDDRWIDLSTEDVIDLVGPDWMDWIIDRMYWGARMLRRSKSHSEAHALDVEARRVLDALQSSRDQEIRWG